MSVFRELFTNRQIQFFSFTWNGDLIAQYESPWSILTKFKYINSITSDELYKLLGEHAIRSLKGQIGDYHKSMYTLRGFNDELLSRALNFPLKHENNKLLNDLLNPLTDNNKVNISFHFMRNYLTFCPLCINKNYHSTLHQFLFVHKCPFHSVPLISKCPKCKNEIPYILEDSYFKSPYVCKCGFEFAKVNRRFNKDSIGPIKNLNLQKWFRHGIKYKERLTSLIMLEELKSSWDYKEENFKIDLSDLYSILSRGNSIITTKEKINQTRSYLQFINNVRHNTKIYDFGEKEEPLYSPEIESHYLCNQLFNAIARNLRKTILSQHINCIKHLTRNESELSIEEKCPFAIAYTYWRKRSQDFKHISYVDNHGTTSIYRRHYSRYGYPINNGSSTIYGLLREWKNKKYYNENRAYYNWIINRFVGELILADFKRCLIAANKSYNLRTKFDLEYIETYDLLSKIIIEPPKDYKGKHIMYLKPIKTILDISTEVNCPNQV